MNVKLDRTVAGPWLCLFCLLALPGVVQGQFTYTTINGTVTIAEYSGPGGDVTIPSTIDGLPVTRIGEKAFESITSLTSVAIPNSVTSIGWGAFRFCYSLKSVTIPGSINDVLEYTFHGCIGLTNVTIGDGVTNIGYAGFQGCSSLTHVTYGRSVATIENVAFAGCFNLQQIYFRGNRPQLGGWSVFGDTFHGMLVYYLPGATGWGLSRLEQFDRFSTRPWLLPNPLILSFVPSFGVQTNEFGFRVSWATNASVVVESCTNFASSTWVPLSTNTIAGVSTWTPTNGWFYFSDPQWTNYPSRLYRVRSQ